MVLLADKSAKLYYHLTFWKNDQYYVYLQTRVVLWFLQCPTTKYECVL